MSWVVLILAVYTLLLKTYKTEALNIEVHHSTIRIKLKQNSLDISIGERKTD